MPSHERPVSNQCDYVFKVCSHWHKNKHQSTLCGGNPLVTGESPHKGPVTPVSFQCHEVNMKDLKLPQLEREKPLCSIINIITILDAEDIFMWEWQFVELSDSWSSFCCLLWQVCSRSVIVIWQIINLWHMRLTWRQWRNRGPGKILI